MEMEGYMGKTGLVSTGLDKNETDEKRKEDGIKWVHCKFGPGQYQICLLDIQYTIVNSSKIRSNCFHKRF
jgi:hypothetical protein